MKLSYPLLIALLCLTCAGVLVWSACHYHGKYQAEKKRADAAELSLSQASATITDMQTRQQDVAALDAKYTKELADAHKTISDLRRDVDAGIKRLHVSATCSDVHKTTTAPGVDDATSAGLTDAAQRDYFTLRERIETAGKMIAGLQEYINTQCLN